MNLTFDEATFDAVICLNGDLPPTSVFETLVDRPLIAADGAANLLVAAGIGPEYVVGDLDSVTQETLERLDGLADLVPEDDQDTTDFEKSIRFAESQLWKNLLVVGMHGGDLEHTLNNWSVLMRHARDLQITAFERDRYAIPVFGSFTYKAAEDELLSLIPQPLATLTTSGLVWNLDNESLELGTREGGRNRAAESSVHVDVHDGSLLFFCSARLPASPIFVVPNT